MKKVMMDKEFRNIYSDIKLSDHNGEMLTLHTHCPNCNICWQHIQDRKPDNNGFWTITRPWVGKNYEELKLLAIAINMNEYGSYEGAIDLMNRTKEEIGRGKRKMFVSKTYNGTFLFHRLGSYVTAFAEKENLLKPTWKGYPSPIDIVSSLEYISYTNHIKCSPVREKSKPTYQMWENCGRYVLKREIEVLQPKKILILGIADNFNYFKQNVLDELLSFDWKGNVGIGRGLFKNREIEITVVPHPASYGGNSSQIMDDLRKVINSSC